MKVSAYLSAALFGTAALSAVAPRQVSVITGVLSDVQDSIGKVDSAVNAYNGGDSSPVVDAGKSLVSTINDGNSKASGVSELSLEDALSLQAPVKSLTSKAQTLVDDLTSKRSVIAENGECATTRTLVGDIDSSSNTLINTIVGKVPQDAQSIAESLVADLKAVLAKAKDNFSEANCVDSKAPASSSAAAGSSAAPTGASSAAPTGGASSAAPTSAAPTATGGYPTGKPTGGAGSSSVVVVPTGTPTQSGIVTVPTGAAGALLPPAAIAVGLAVALL